MLTSKVQASQSTLQNLPLKMPDGFKTTVIAPRNPKLVKREDKAKKLTPSVYAQELSQTTEERLANTYETHLPRILELLDMSETTHHKFSTVDVDQPFFQPYPSEIVFQNYMPSETYEVPLVLRNTDKIPHLVKVVEEASLYFRVVSPVDIGSKVAPGMTSTFTILFTPQENKDYIHRLICVTEREKFEVPIRAIGARAILDFPDQLHFPLCPVKCSMQKTLLVRNIGNGRAKFQLSIQSPFSVEPSVGTLGVGESMQMTIEFLPRTTGDHSQQLLLHYNTGEDVYVSLYGASSDVNVRLDRNSVLLEKTYITMASERTVAILNRSDSIVHYQWKSFATQEEEEQHRLRFCMELQQEEADEMEQFLIECGADPNMRDRLSLLSRTFQHRRRQLRREPLLFNDKHIILEPQEGDIWPNRTAEINIIFKPQEARLYQHTVYCDVTGRESRLPLRIKAEGMGPKLQFNFDLLDVGNVFIGSKHSYEVLVSNKGLIDGPYRLEPPSTAMGLCFSFSPTEGMVPPGACHALEVRFSSDKLGTFFEEFRFTVVGNPQPLKLTFRGCVMGPTFHFSVLELNFGEVSFGFPYTLTCSLSNTSLVSMSFDLRIPADGNGADSITTTEQISQLDRNEWTAVDRVSERPQEFRVTPTSGSIRAQGQMDIKVTLCSNTVQQYSLALVVDVHGVGEEVLALPIKARCVVPEVHLDSPELQFQYCFLGHPYQQSIKLINDTGLPACYGLLAQEYEENPSLLFSSAHPRGVIQPCSTEQIPLVLQAKTVGPQHLTALIAILGQQGPPLVLHLSCIGQGPAISLSATELHFGTIPVLSDVPRMLQLSNSSPIPARFVAHMARSKSQWRVEPVEGEVPPHGQLELHLVANLDDTLPFQDKLQLAIQDSPTCTVAVTATGKGTTIVTDRPFAPSLDLGAHFSSGPCQYHFRVSNRGRRLHQLYWATEGYPQFRRRGLLPSRASKEGKAKGPLAPPPQDAPIFVLTPMRLELAPGQSAHMLLEGSCDVPKVVRERLVCHAIVGHQSGKERIMTVDVTCRFISPVLEISSQQLNFYVEKVPGMSLVPQYQSLHLKSVSALALSLELTVPEPFGLCECTGDDLFTITKCLVLGVGAETVVRVRFDPSYRPELESRVTEAVLEIRYCGHPQRDSVALRGEVHFPNLHFSSKAVDFGCVLNCTEAQRQLTMTNCSPLPVSYRWAFLLDQKHYSIRFPSEKSSMEGVMEERQDDTPKEPSPTLGAPTRGRWSRPQLAEKEPVDKKDPETNIKEGSGSPKEPSTTSGPDVLGWEEGLTHDRKSSTSLGQENLRMYPTERPTATEQRLSTASLTSREVPGVEEVFDILPIYGVLQPGERQLVTFSFFGHTHISGQVLALCEVEDGPTYEITLKGEASLLTYALDTTDIDFGPQLFDRVAEAEITLRNTGKVGFDFSALLTEEKVSSEDPLSGQPLVIPSRGYVEATAEMKLSVYYLPGMPEVFHKTLQLQVAFFEPVDITLRGEGVFPRVCLDLPRDLDEERYSSVLKEAREAVESRRQREEALSRPGTGWAEELCEEDCTPTVSALMEPCTPLSTMEVERFLLKENAINIEKSRRDSEQRESPGSTDSRWRKKLRRIVLPEYILDFGYVIHGNIPTHIIKVTNTGPVSVTFRAEHRSLAGTGFSTELDRVKNLPYCETETFEVKFDPRGANLDLGEINTVMSLQVLGGPTVQVRLHAVVTMPSLTACTDVLNFNSVQCGMCQVATVQLQNPEHVPCEWSIKEEEQPKRKTERHVPLHLRRKAPIEQPPPLIFEMLPSSGVVYPGDRVNVQVKFSPAEGRAYRETLVIAVAQSTQRVLLLAQGQGEEPQLEFSTSVLELGPVLPYSNGEEAEVLVRNTCPYPIEFYSLDFDKQYLEEEKILRMMNGYDAQKVLLLPPRAPGEPLPAELLDYYKQNSSREPGHESKPGSPKEDETSNTREKGECVAQEEELSSSPHGARPLEDDRVETSAVLSKDISPSGADQFKGDTGVSYVGDLEENPVSRAIAHYMGVDLSPEGQAAHHRNGIGIIVHGAPLSGKTALAVSLARHYGAACLTLDGVVQEAVSSGTSGAAMQARELMELTQTTVEDTDVAGSAGQAVGVLSVEAVARHTAEGVQATDRKAPASTVSTCNKTSITGPKNNNSSNPTATSMAGQVHRVPSESMSQNELAAMSSLLPDDLLVEILSERLQLSDCHRGVMIDSLETLFCRSPSAALQIILKAFNNRQHIYVIDLINNYYAFKATERERLQRAEALQREQIEREQLRLQDMDEDEYDALPEEEKEQMDLRHREMIREQKRSAQKRLEQEQEEQRQQEEMERLREEEEMKKKNKKGKKEVPKDDSSGKRSQLGVKQSAVALHCESKLDQQPAVPKEGRAISACTDNKDGKDSPLESARELEDGGRKKKSKENKDSKPGGHEESLLTLDDLERELCTEAEKQLLSRFRLYEQSQLHVQHVLRYWDRTQGVLLQAPSSDEPPQEPEEAAERRAPSGKKAKKEREKEKAERERHERERLKTDAADLKLLSPATSQALVLHDGAEGSERDSAPQVIPHICVSISGKEQPGGTELLCSLKLPSLEEVLDGLGLGPRGPPIPPPMLFSVVPYPKKRSVPCPQLTSSAHSPAHSFTFLVPSSLEDLSKEKKEEDLKEEAPTPMVPAKEEVATPTKGKGKNAPLKDVPLKERLKDKRRSPAKKGGKSTASRSPPLSAVTSLSDTDLGRSVGDSQSERSQRLTHFRWVVPANGEVTMKIWFRSTVAGSFDQTLSFEVMGTKRCYQLCCRGICTFPSVSKDHKTVFSHCKKVLQPGNGLQKTYIIRSSLYDFGPLLCGKIRDRYKERKYPENTERLVMHNNSSMEAEVYFCFQHDTKATTFILDPSSMVLKPNEKKELRVWAYPTTPGLIEDSVMCYIKDNPEPAVFRIACRGVRPELEVDRKFLNFDKILLHRRDTRSLCLRNPTMLPVVWKLSGLEMLGDEFSVSQDHGVIMPHSEFSLHLHFRAMKPINLKKAIRLEVSDVENILGIVHTENIQIIAEAYDVNLDITFLKGADGGLDFGTIKVGEEAKLSVNLKNKGKYEIAYKFMLEPTEPGMPNLNSMFTITPLKGSLHPNERHTSVQFIFCYSKEVSIKEQPILKCQVIEPNIAEGEETIVIIPITISAKSVFSKYSLTPPNDINFGALIHGSRKMKTLTVENHGDFDIRFIISRMCKDFPVPAQRKSMGKKPSRESHSARPSVPSKLRRSDSVQKDFPTQQSRMTMGVFSLTPCFGVLSPGAQQVVTVECVAEQTGHWKECLVVDISDRDPSDSPGGMPYRLIAEVCIPGIAHKDIASIFEEHRLCKNSNMLHCEQYRDAMGIYIQDENKFVFNNVLVGRSAKARFRLSNPGKVPCELNLQVKAVLTKMSVRIAEVFELTPTRMTIPSHSHAFATVTFSPQAMQTYLAVFEATLEGATGLLPTSKGKVLVFDLMGEGNLPYITVLKPVQRNSQGQPVLHFNRLLVGKGQSLPLVIKNISSVPAQVSIDLLDKMGVFAMQAVPDTSVCSHISSHITSDPGTERQTAHVATMTLKEGQRVRFEVEFYPEEAQHFEANIQLLVQDNQYEDTVVQLLGEGYCDIISLDNISSKVLQDQDNAERPLTPRSDLLHFGDCQVGCLYHETFTLSNHSDTEVLRFEWPPDGPQVRFSPRMGHLHAGCTKEITASFCSEQPVVLSAQVVKYKLCQIAFHQPVDQVPDWDDRLRTVKWVESSTRASLQRPAKRKVVEADPEPAHLVLENSSRELELRISATCNYAKFKCDIEPIQFKDTMLYQTRVFQMQMANQGTVELEYSWQVIMDTLGKPGGFNQQGTTPRSGLRPASSLVSVSTLLLGDPELPPFNVEPSVGLIQAGASQTFSLRFSPLEVAHYEARLVCSIPNLQGEQGPVITVSGRCLLPYCHFNLENSDYLSMNRRNPELRGPHGAPPRTTLDPDTKVIEFTSLGVGTSVCREFSIINPTNKPYSFLWKCEDSEAKPFTCLTPNNTIQPGKKVDVSFRFHAHEPDLVESFWTFLVPEHKLSVPFLLVGVADDPMVYIDHAHLNLGSLLIGHKMHKTVYVVNGEDQPFHFTIEQFSRYSEAFRDSLLLEPMAGTVPPRDKIPLVISFTPMQEGPVMFNLLVPIRGKAQPLTMNVKAECYSMNAYVQYESPEGVITELSDTNIHLVDFKLVELSDRSTCAFLVSNPGKFNLDVQYELTGPADLQRHLQAEPRTAVVPVGGQSRCVLGFFPLQKCDLKDVGFLIKVKNGPVFHCSLLGSASPPGLEFSFVKFNFGMRFIYCAGMVPTTHTLVISNKGERGISVECLFSNTPFLEVSFTPEVLPPGGRMEVSFTFYPREAVSYHEKVVFDINECSKQVVEILGQGIEMKIDIEDPKQKVVKVGALQVGQRSKKLIPLINNSRSPLTFSLLLTSSTHALLDSKVLSVHPEGDVTLRAGGGRCVVEVLFAPRQRMAPFSAELQLECLGTVRPLLVLKGCCQGVEVMLDQDYLSFGAVAQHCQTARRIILQNTGDIGARFQWDLKCFAPDFSICPAKGYLCPGVEVPLEVTFAPVEVKQDLCYENLCCSIEGGKPVTLTLAGSCIVPPVASQVVNFVCPVRGQCTQSLTLSNRTNQRWSLKPVIEGEYWNASPSFVLEPYQQNKAYEITYKPVVMTTEGRKHLGSVFFSFPDGAGMLYSLQGTADPPKAVGTISHEVPCKTPYTEIVPVHNWLPKPQRFRVTVEMVKLERPDNTVSLKGLDYVDVPALAKRDYKISFFSYKEGQYNAKVTFKNETTGEYLFYNLSFKATPPGVISTIEMVTAARQTTSACVKVDNPLPTSLVFSAECRSADVNLPSQLSVPALSKGTLTFEYQPLRPGESTTRLVLYNSELGFFHHELLLRAHPALPEKPLYFQAQLGAGHSLNAKFTNYSRAKAEYTCKTDCPDFIVEKNITAAAGFQAGTDVSVEVYFEPSKLGEVRGTLTLSSSFAGEYVFPLCGTCLPPKAQGPLAIRAGSSVSIPFKNVFLQATAFSFQVDNPVFTVKGVETIHSKKTHNISVSFEGPPAGSKGPCTGKLTISSPRSEGHGQVLSWVYYLKGFCPELPQREKTL
ncbi:hydrocephalus-inducing protein homolog [Electrophorus electricus]|uniref:hydrocephalus-inducing protein homolog n=1 Tax=Electrophorus electricus TaxID=8005 RepID=UPI0015CFD09D|nr:hydrocephalus-inducing protein homolog [Electrophorus electricus]